ncbi:MAG: protein kinase [Chitinivibrionales bacterium]|nr:protein kinase [Chitinivibrionales bacterium]
MNVNNDNVNPYKDTVPELGTKIGPNKIELLIGEGGNANIYKAWHTGLEVVRALKILKKGNNKEAKDRFLTEAKILADIRHPNIIEIHGLGYWDRQVPFIEMEYLDGSPVAKLIAQNSTIVLPAALAIVYYVCQALHYAHAKDYTLYGKIFRGLIHRDIKPDNIFLSKAGIVKLMDFGIARPSEISLHTVGDKIMGTLVYLSPEQLGGGTLDHRTDIFSLGAVLYEMISGHRAFPQKKLSDLVQAKTRGQYKPLDSYGIPVPSSVKETVERAMAINPDERFSNAAQFGQAVYASLREISDLSPDLILTQLVRDPSSITIKKNAVGAGKKLFLWGLFGAGAAIGLGALLFYIFG